MIARTDRPPNAIRYGARHRGTVCAGMRGPKDPRPADNRPPRGPKQPTPPNPRDPDKLPDPPKDQS